MLRLPLFAKPSTRVDEPLSFRILSVLCLLYRVWTKYRFEDLRPWVAAWATSDMFALAEHTDATLAWCRSALLRERAYAKGCPFSGSCDDIWKAYGTVDRQGRLGQVIPGEMFEDDVMEWLRAG